MKPMLAEDWVESKVRFPVLVQPKIDGVRAMNLGGGLVARSGKAHGNRHVTRYFSHEALVGLDGEMAAEKETHPSLCRLTTSAISTREGEPWLMWHVFDFITPLTVGAPYRLRYAALKNRLFELSWQHPVLAAHLKLVPSAEILTLEELNTFDAAHLDAGYEGSILRSPEGLYKEGRSTVKEGGLLRVKRFIEEEAVVLEVIEGQTNTNEATLDPHGYTERSTQAAGMLPNGMVGAMRCRVVKTGQEITVAAGSMPHDLRRLYWQQPQLIVGKTIKFKTFPKGVKDKPRFPTFQTIRAEEDQ